MKQLYSYGLAIWAVLLFAACGGDDTPAPPTPPDDDKPTVPQNIPTTQSPQKEGTTYWWNEAVYYEIFVRSFYDSNGDGIGDLNGIKQKLDYIQNYLGATAIWLMPINSSPSYHGYDVTDYRSIHPDYGTMGDFKALVNEIHSRGMKIIIDLVINHTSNESEWFQSAWNSKTSSYRDWYVWENNKPNWGNWHGDAKHGYYYGAFSYTMPDLNYKNQVVKDEIKSISDYWLKDIAVDGFRLDAVKFLVEEGTATENTSGTLAYWNEFGNNVKSANADAMTVAEAWDSSTTIAKYVNTSLDLAFEFGISYTLKEAVKTGNPQALKNKIKEIRDLYPYQQYATFISNHDQDRSYEVMGKSISNSKLAAAVMLTLPGTPFIYYGEEIGMWGTKSGGDEWVRTPLHWTNDATTGGFTTGTPWWKIIGDQETKNIATQKNDANSLLNWYKTMANIRKKYSQFTKGTFQNLGTNEAKIYAYLREKDGTGIVVLHNFGSATNNTRVYGQKTNLLAGTYAVTDLLTGEKLDDIALNNDGGFDFSPLKTLATKETKLLLLKKKS